MLHSNQVKDNASYKFSPDGIEFQGVRLRSARRVAQLRAQAEELESQTTLCDSLYLQLLEQGSASGTWLACNCAAEQLSRMLDLGQSLDGRRIAGGVN